MRVDFHETADKRRPQLPCSTNYGAYPSYTVPAGTVVRIRRKGYSDDWTDHKTRQSLTFTKSMKTTGSGIVFQHSGYLIWVRRDRIKGGMEPKVVKNGRVV